MFGVLLAMPYIQGTDVLGLNGIGTLCDVPLPCVLEFAHRFHDLAHCHAKWVQHNSVGDCQHLDMLDIACCRGFDLAVEYVIHTVGPIYEAYHKQEAEIHLANAYKYVCSINKLFAAGSARGVLPSPLLHASILKCRKTS